MNKILSKVQFSENVFKFEVEVPQIEKIFKKCHRLLFLINISMTIYFLNCFSSSKKEKCKNVGDYLEIAQKNIIEFSQMKRFR